MWRRMRTHSYARLGWPVGSSRCHLLRNHHRQHPSRREKLALHSPVHAPADSGRRHVGGRKGGGPGGCRGEQEAVHGQGGVTQDRTQARTRRRTHEHISERLMPLPAKIRQRPPSSVLSMMQGTGATAHSSVYQRGRRAELRAWNAPLQRQPPSMREADASSASSFGLGQLSHGRLRAHPGKQTLRARPSTLTRPPDAAAGLSAFASSAASTHSQKMSMGSESAVVVVLQSTLHCEQRTLPIFAFLLLRRTGSRAGAPSSGPAHAQAHSSTSARSQGGPPTRWAEGPRGSRSEHAWVSRGRYGDSHRDADGAGVVAVHAVEAAHHPGARLFGHLLRGLALAHAAAPPLALGPALASEIPSS